MCLTHRIESIGYNWLCQEATAKSQIKTKQDKIRKLKETKKDQTKQIKLKNELESKTIRANKNSNTYGKFGR